MRTNIVLDDALVAEVMEATHIKTRREVVDFALREVLARYNSQQLRELRGKGLIDPNYDILEVRRREGQTLHDVDPG
ncbi:MAG: type II toxin-antitoxin system VapB family antitoxin [Sinobacteraceae bacterium]|nr:type II toxin-antitoxin system VapB family antitoxin [Nevskiaceae bacterium]